MAAIASGHARLPVEHLANLPIVYLMKVTGNFETSSLEVAGFGRRQCVTLQGGQNTGDGAGGDRDLTFLVFYPHTTDAHLYAVDAVVKVTLAPP